MCGGTPPAGPPLTSRIPGFIAGARTWSEAGPRVTKGQPTEHLVGGQQDLMPAYLDAQWEEAAQRYAAQLIRARANMQRGLHCTHEKR